MIEREKLFTPPETAEERKWDTEAFLHRLTGWHLGKWPSLAAIVKCSLIYATLRVKSGAIDRQTAAVFVYRVRDFFEAYDLPDVKDRDARAALEVFNKAIPEGIVPGRAFRERRLLDACRSRLDAFDDRYLGILSPFPEGEEGASVADRLRVPFAFVWLSIPPGEIAKAYGRIANARKVVDAA